MNTIFKKYLTTTIISSLCLIALGLLLIFKARDVMFTLSYVIGAILVALGTVAIIRFLRKAKNQEPTNLEFAYGIISIILGIIVISHPQGIASIVPIILGIAIIINSANKLDYSFQLKSENNKVWKATMIISIISTLCGLILLFNPFAAAEAATVVIGVFIIVYALLDLISAFTVRKSVITITINERELPIKDAEIIEEKEDEEEVEETVEEPEVKEEKEETKKEEPKKEAAKKETKVEKKETKPKKKKEKKNA